MIKSSMKTVWLSACAVAMLLATAGRPWTVFAQAPEPTKGVKFATLSEADAREWLTYLSSDALQGRQVFTEGYGLAVSYIAEHLRAWGLKPVGDDGTYFQSVKRKAYRATRNSSLTVTVGDQTRTFKHGDHVTFPAAAGGKQTLTFTGAEFMGYGVVSPTATPPYNDYSGRDVKGKLVVMLPGAPSILAAGQAAGGRGGAAPNMNTRVNYAVQTAGAAATITFAAAPAAPTPAQIALADAQAALAQATQAVTEAQAAVLQAQRGGGAGRAGGGGGRGGAGRGAQTAVQPDFTSVQRVDNIVTPQITGDETFYDFLFSGSATKYVDLKAKAERGEALNPMTLANVKVTVNIDNQYDVLTTELTKNVVGMVEGSDPRLKDTYVMFGAHLDHVGYRTSGGAGRGGRAGGGGAAGVETAAPDLIFNGADDDGSGSTGLLGIAKAFATGPKPKRSVVFVWHAGEEAGLLGSRYNADFPVVPLDKVQAQLNIDMIGRNRNDDATQSNSVFVIGADRISTDLHNLVVDTNDTLTKPVHLDYEYNDPSDTNSFYTRSDHYSYALKGIPIAFFFTGTHPDYHGAGDQVEKILFPKLVSIAQLVYQAGFNIANTERTLVRDNLGPRTVKGFQGKIKK